MPESTSILRPESAAPAHVAVFSDLHLSDVEQIDPRRPLWRRYKQEASHPDQPVVALLDHLSAMAKGGRIELVLNGDIFDFDTMLSRPAQAAWKTTWLERARGLAPEQDKSTWKMRRILDHHPELMARLRVWLAAGHTLVFIIGNHDLELHWPAVQQVLMAALRPPTPESVRVCAWFCVRGDTLITHGNQLDDYCVCQDPLHPLIDKNGVARVRMPFGNLAGKLILNGIGLLNPHVDDSFIKSPVEYLRFFFKYLARTQPFVLFSWMWAAFATLGVTLDEGMRPALHDPLTLAARESEVAAKAGVSPDTLRALQSATVHPALFRPLRLARELWLDRLLLLVGVLIVAVGFGSTLHLLGGAGGLGMLIALGLLLPPFLLYSWSVRSHVKDAQTPILKGAVQLARIAGTQRVILGHTHREVCETVSGVELINTGHWSPAFRDLDCSERVGVRGFAWLTPGPNGRMDAELRIFDGVSSQRYREAPVAAVRTGLAVA